MSAPEPTLRFHHVGYAVERIADYRRDFFDPLFQPETVSKPVEDPLQRVRVCFARMPGGVVIELVEPAAEDSPLKAVIGSARGGVYHLCYEVTDLDAAIAAFRAKRCLPVTRPLPAAAFGGRRIIFLMTPQRDLVEILESGTGPASAPSDRPDQPSPPSASPAADWSGE